MPNFNPDNYIDVQERINRFWSEHPGGAIRTNLMSAPDDFSQCRYKAEIFKNGQDGFAADATGFAFEIAGGGGANRTSHEENCETSAIGRALANMGYATSREDRPSKQEMVKVTKEPPKSLYPTPVTPASTYVDKQPDDAERARAMKKLHAIAGALGLSHDDLHAIAVGRKKGSLKDLDAPTLLTFGSWLETAPDTKIQELISAGKASASSA